MDNRTGDSKLGRYPVGSSVSSSPPIPPEQLGSGSLSISLPLLVVPFVDNECINRSPFLNHAYIILAVGTAGG
ncbi:hypothetical protein MLD38_039187 [Melastoma candidum]|uniref:Uncharacterized protein n=1 Tax=Melastoma candidum TaxID=119954 RepID=A0ACB9L2I7_9MYRT|nr:hypothetical protein MLD38_039187 [Melastoma candidum]